MLDLGGSEPTRLLGTDICCLCCCSVITLVWPAPQSSLSAVSHINYQFNFIERMADRCLCLHHLTFSPGLVASKAAIPGTQASGWLLKAANLSSFAWKVWGTPAPKELSAGGGGLV